MNKKLFAVIGFMLVACGCAFASNIGYSSVHSGFWWRLWSFVLAFGGGCAAAGVAVPALLPYYPDSFDDWFTLRVSVVVVIGLCGLILGYQMFPTVWCGAIGAILGVFSCYSFLYPPATKKGKQGYDLNWCAVAFAIVMIAFTISVEVFAFVFLPDEWWLWKYFAIAGIGSGCGNVVSLTIHRFDKRLPIWLVSLMIPEFIAFWIVFANCGMNIVSAILLIIFAILLFLTLVSPLILFLMESVKNKKEAEKRRVKEASERERNRKEAERRRAEEAAEKKRKEKEEREIYIKAKAEADAREESKQREIEVKRIMKELCPGRPSGEHDFSDGNFCKFCGKKLR